MISHFTVGAVDLMVASLAMSGLAMLVAILATWQFAAGISLAGTSLVIHAGRALAGFVLSKLWMASLLSMLALYNAIGGGAASAVAAVEMSGNRIGGVPQFILVLAVALVGAASLSGSLVAWAKLNGFLKVPSWTWGPKALRPMALAIALAAGGCIVLTGHDGANRLSVTPELVCWLLGCALLLGVLLTLPFREWQMPVLISLFNAFTGLAIGLEGFVLRNPALLIVGIVIGTARVFVTLLMVES